MYVDNIMLCGYRMMNISVLICLIILTNQCVCTHSNVITVNSRNGNDNTECCVRGECPCSSLSTALLNIKNYTIINITSESVALDNATTIRSVKLSMILVINLVFSALPDHCHFSQTVLISQQKLWIAIFTIMDIFTVVII